ADPSEIIAMISQPEELEGLLKEAKIRPIDVRDQRGDEGTATHAFLERLINVALAGDPGDADPIAEVAVQKGPSLEAGVGAWWLESKPIPIAGELFVRSLKHGFAGTVDLVQLHPSASFSLVTDLKTRGVGKGVYDSDYVQVDAYAIAYEEMRGHRVSDTSVLIVREDGSYEESISPLPRGTFLDVLSLDRKLQAIERR
ncbi:MAG: hypothetical protein ACREIQ_04555, partial [Nitrospiria bacterium]